MTLVNMCPNVAQTIVDVNFICAVLHWLAAFPNSPVIERDKFGNLGDFNHLLEILRMILDETFLCDDDGDSISQIEDPVLRLDKLFENVVLYYKSKSRSRKKLSRYLKLLNSADLIEGGTFQWNVLCCLFFEIGLHGSKSSLAISLISTLEEEYQIQLNNFIHDQEDFVGKNLILAERIDRIEADNSQLKEQLKSEQKKSKPLKKQLVTFQEEVDQLQSVISSKDEEILYLSGELEQQKAINKQLQKEIELLHDDVKLVTGYLPQKQVVQPRNEVDSFERWEHNLLKQLLRYKYGVRPSV